MDLSRNFTLEEFTRSQTATRLGIFNTPTADEVSNMIRLCVRCLEPIRDLFGGRPIIITSGFRCRDLNSAIGGSPTSQHMKGQAADFYVHGVSVPDAFRKIIHAPGVDFDQVINEFGEWIHVSFATPLRREKLIAYREQGKTLFRRI